MKRRAGRQADEVPNDLALERAVLGQLLMFGALTPQFRSAGLRSADFYREVHQILADAIFNVADRGATPDLVTVSMALSRSQMEEIGRPYFSALVDGVPKPTETNIAEEANRLRELRARREVFKIFDRHRSDVLGGNTLQSDFLDRCIDELRDVSSWRTTSRPSAFISAKALADTQPVEVAWIAKPYVAVGCITDLAGQPKAAGKTTLAAHLVDCVLRGDSFLGELTSQTKVVYLTEQTRPSFKIALQRAGLLEREDLLILSKWDVPDMTWPDVVAEAVRQAKGINAGLLVVDTLAQFAGLHGDDENNAGAALHAVEPLHRAAHAGLGILVSRHERKGGGAVGESARGSSAFIGAVDIVLALQRPEGNQRPTVRKLAALSRFDETPDAVLIEKVGDGFINLGSETAAARATAESAIIDQLPLCEESAIATDALLDALRPFGIKTTTGKDALSRLFTDGRAKRIGGGKKKDPHRWWRASEDVPTTAMYQGSVS